MEESSIRSRPNLLGVFAPFAFGYFLSYLYRVVNAVIAPDLIADLGLGPDDLGLLTAAYFLTFASFQLPLGVLLDRFGPRRIEAVLLVFASAGAFVFAGAGTTLGLLLGRALIGFGVSACLMAAFKAYVIWFPKERLPLINGFQMAAGGIGALAATTPVRAALQVTDWRGLFTVLAMLTLAVAAAIFFVVPDRKSGSGDALIEQLRGIAKVYRSRVFWRLAPLTMMTQSTFLAIQGLWAGPWLRDVAGLDRMTVANALLLVAAAMVTGYILLGAVADRLSRIGIKPLAFTVLGLSAFMIVQVLIVLQWTGLTWPLWVVFGFLGTTGIISYAVLSQSFPSGLAGRVNTGLNLLVFIAAFAAQWGIGAVINLWPTAVDGGYARPAYRAGFGMMLVLEVLALLWYILASIKVKRGDRGAAGADPA